ncbi:unnamed protein product [Tetraodon nigroviridis]|uniref:Chromosome 13 SCAF7124, whole genome shotgun sequence n=1 Tax=Tetraodon nigroviridis TaxID=99883 RepID=Q4TBI6_TETNG|nr:unnamed protein product [Tetraodon nigroviridis]
MPKKQKVGQRLCLRLFGITVKFSTLVTAGPRTAGWCWSCRTSLSSGSGPEWSRDHHRARQARLQAQQGHSGFHRGGRSGHRCTSGGRRSQRGARSLPGRGSGAEERPPTFGQGSCANAPIPQHFCRVWRLS